MSNPEEKQVDDDQRPPEQKSAVKYDWYQTEQQIVVQILAKNVDNSKVNIGFSKSAIDVFIPLSDGSSFDRKISLSHDIVPDKSFHKTTPSKVEIRLIKATGVHWSELEMKQEQQKKACSRNWDKVVAEIEEDPQEGEAALNALFQKIYSEGSDEVKKAMNKSFLESGGTELNTNWDAVKKEKVSIKPPDGMEWKKWDQ